MSQPLVAASRLVGDQVYRPHQGLAVYVVDVRYGWVSFDIYEGTRRIGKARMPRATFLELFTNYSEKVPL